MNWDEEERQIDQSEYIEHPEESGEVRSFEAVSLKHGLSPVRALLHLAERVLNFEVKNKKRVSRLYLTQSKDYIYLEAFYKE